MVHAIDIKIRGYHLDVYGHVNNARHLEFLEEARWSFLESRMDLETLMEKGRQFVVVNININYRRPALLNDVLNIETALQATRHHSAILRQTAKRKETGAVFTEAEVTFVILDAKSQKPLRLDGEAAELMDAIKR